MTSWRDRERLVRLVRLVWLMRFRITRMTGVSWTDRVHHGAAHTGGRRRSRSARCRPAACARPSRCSGRVPMPCMWQWLRRSGPSLSIAVERLVLVAVHQMGQGRSGCPLSHRSVSTLPRLDDGLRTAGWTRLPRFAEDYEVPPTTPFTIESKSTTAVGVAVSENRPAPS